MINSKSSRLKVELFRYLPCKNGIKCRDGGWAIEGFLCFSGFSEHGDTCGRSLFHVIEELGVPPKIREAV